MSVIFGFTAITGRPRLLLIPCYRDFDPAVPLYPAADTDINRFLASPRTGYRPVSCILWVNLATVRACAYLNQRTSAHTLHPRWSSSGFLRVHFVSTSGDTMVARSRCRRFASVRAEW